MEKKLLTVRETAQVLGVSPGSIYNKISRGHPMPFELRPIRVGRSVRFRKVDVDKLTGEKE